MTKNVQNTFAITKITVIGTIIVAIISLVGNLVLGYWQFILKPSEANQPTPTPNTTSLAIEQIPFKIEIYDGERGDSTCCTGTAYFSLINNERFFPEYLLRYTFPEGSSKWGYAGIEFIFSNSRTFLYIKTLNLQLYLTSKQLKQPSNLKIFLKHINKFLLQEVHNLKARLSYR